jgi:hypothetical protein
LEHSETGSANGLGAGTTQISTSPIFCIVQNLIFFKTKINWLNIC